jgi:hypothetical protein
MKYCEKCKVNIIGKRNSCPLCQGILQGQDDNQHDIFPEIYLEREEYSFMLKVLLFMSIVTVTVAVALNVLFPLKGAWSVFVIGGIASVWASIISAIHKRKNLPKNIIYQVVLLSIISVIWDRMTHWKGWSIDYVVPLICVAAMISMALISKIRRQRIEDFMVYFILDGLFGIVPLIFMLTGILNVIYPSLICIVSSVISLSALLIFQGEKMIAEVKRRTHM